MLLIKQHCPLLSKLAVVWALRIVMSSNSTTYPPGYESYDGGPAVIRVMTAVIVVATVFVGLRVGVRIHRRIGLKLDDWLIIVALVIEWAEYVDGYLCIKLGGVGLHLPIAIARRPDALRNTFIVSHKDIHPYPSRVQ